MTSRRLLTDELVDDAVDALRARSDGPMLVFRSRDGFFLEQRPSGVRVARSLLRRLVSYGAIRLVRVTGAGADRITVYVPTRAKVST